MNVLHRLIVNGCVLSPMYENKRRYNTIDEHKNAAFCAYMYRPIHVNDSIADSRDYYVALINRLRLEAFIGNLVS